MIEWLYNHYFLTAAISSYYMALVGYGTVQMFADISAVSASSATAYATLMLLPAAAAEFIRWRVDHDKSDP